MMYFAGLDVSLEDTSICIVDEAGQIVREFRAASEPEALIAALPAPIMRRLCVYREEKRVARGNETIKKKRIRSGQDSLTSTTPIREGCKNLEDRADISLIFPLHADDLAPKSLTS